MTKSDCKTQPAEPAAQPKAEERVFDHGRMLRQLDALDGWLKHEYAAFRQEMRALITQQAELERRAREHLHALDVLEIAQIAGDQSDGDMGRVRETRRALAELLTEGKS